jgi:hypothetical protein
LAKRYRKQELRRGAEMHKLTIMVATPFSLHDPEYYAHRYLESADAFRFIELKRAEHAAMPFLIDEYLGTTRETRDIAADECLAGLDKGRLHFLFHSAFCGSTLLTRALDMPGMAMGLSEPATLNDVVGLRWRGGSGPAIARVADAALRLLARPFGAGEAVVIKPSNLLNPTADLLLALQPDARAVFLYAPLETYLISVVRKGLHCRLWVRQLLEGFLREGYADFGFSPEDYFRQTDLQVAAIGWLAQHRHFTQLVRKLGEERVATLDADRMTARPAEAISAVTRHYGLACDAATVARIVAGPAFSKHSKSGAAFNVEDRQAEYEAARGAYGEEIDMVLAWALQVAESVGITLEPPGALLT